MSSPARTSPRARLTRHQVLQAALALIDRDGLDGLSMRRLASDLGVEPMSLYNHVASKDDLLAGLADLIWAEIAAAAPPTTDWAAWLRAFAHAIRQAVHRHPNTLPVLVSGEVIALPALELFADELEQGEHAAADRAGAIRTLRTVAAFALGCAVCEQSCFGPTPPPEEETERQRLLRIGRALPPEAPDRLVTTAIEVCGDCDADRLFTDGLDLILRGSELAD